MTTDNIKMFTCIISEMHENSVQIILILLTSVSNVLKLITQRTSSTTVMQHFTLQQMKTYFVLQ